MKPQQATIVSISIKPFGDNGNGEHISFQKQRNLVSMATIKRQLIQKFAKRGCRYFLGDNCPNMLVLHWHDLTICTQLAHFLYLRLKNQFFPKTSDVYENWKESQILEKESSSASLSHLKSQVLIVSV